MSTILQSNEPLPLVSIIMATYNRAHTIGRAVDTVLNQTYENFELIIIDDGSTDNTLEILKKYNDPRIRIFINETNQGVTAAKNRGFKQIKGEWFGTFDSDDELMPYAIETLMNIPLNMDNKITSVIGNCADAITGKLRGKGLTKDAYIHGNEVMSYVEGDFFGLIKTSLLQNDLLNENIRGLESVLWYKINARANKYYTHKVLNIMHTEGKDRVSTSKFKLTKSEAKFEHLIDEDFFLEITSRYKPRSFYKICRNGILIMNATGKRDIADRYFKLFNKYSKMNLKIEFVYRFKILSFLIKLYSKILKK
jgi:glycosyltransferase involved in cell wall biosynthesis